MKSKKRIALLLLMLFAVTHAGLVFAATEQPITLRLAWWGGQTRHEKMLAIAEAYMERNPNVIIECEYTGDYDTKLTAQLAAGVEPDLFWVTINSAALYMSKSALLNLDPYIDNGLDISTISGAILESGMYGGSLYCVANGVNASVMLYDPDAFASLGIDKPDDLNWTWEDLEEISLRFVSELGIYGVQEPFIGNTNFHYFVRTKGYEWYNDEGTALGFTDPAVMEAFFAMALRWQQAGICPTQDILAQALGIEDQFLAKGQAAMAFHDSNQITTQSKVAGKPLAFLLNPGPDNEKGLFVKPACFTVVSANTQYPEACVDFLNFFTNDPVAGAIFNGEVGVPVSDTIREHLITTLEGDAKLILQRQFDIIDLVAEHSSPVNLIYPGKHNEVRQILTDVAEKVLYEVITPAEAAVEFMTEANRILGN